LIPPERLIQVPVFAAKSDFDIEKEQNNRSFMLQ
jgi:hypothetical protein